MKRHTQIYLDYFGYEPGDFIPSEISGGRAVDICHIDCRGMGGDPTGEKDRIENLMAQTRNEHIELGDKVHTKAYEYRIHLEFLEKYGKPFDKEYITNQISKYEDSEILT